MNDLQLALPDSFVETFDFLLLRLGLNRFHELSQSTATLEETRRSGNNG